MPTKNKLQIVYKNVDDLIPYARNAKIHDENHINLIAGSIKSFGFNNPVLLDGENGIIAGHGRVLAAKKLGMKQIPTIELQGLSETEKRAYIIADNRLTEKSEWDKELLSLELQDLNELGVDLNTIGFSNDEFENIIGGGNPYELTDEHKGKLKEKFLIAPFSVINTQSGEWIKRKQEWMKICNEQGQSRENKLNFGNISDTFKSVSILDPVLCEIILQWFTPNEGASVCDSFAGDLSMGFVAGFKGFNYTGIELRQEQADLNNSRLLPEFNARWICDDGQNILKHIQPNSQDLYFSCPPYFDLEKYSDLPNDASNQDYEGFIKILANGLKGGVAALKENRFAVIVMSNVRDSSSKGKGFYKDICSDITRIMAEAGAYLYNEIILVNSVGTAAIRVSGYMEHRKVARIHQEVLVYFKGDPKNIKGSYGPIELPKDLGVPTDER